MASPTSPSGWRLSDEPPEAHERVFEVAPEEDLLYSLGPDGKRRFMHPQLHRARTWRRRLGPINPGSDRAAVLAALRPVDYICFFRSTTPARLIAEIVPDVLVKGADWKRADIVGGDLVERTGGAVRRVRLSPGRSTTAVIKRVLQAYPRGGRA